MTREAGSAAGSGPPDASACRGVIAPNRLIYVPVQVSPLNADEPTGLADRFLDAVVDTGANRTVVSPGVVERLGLATRPGPAVRTSLRAHQDAGVCELEVWLTSSASTEAGDRVRAAIAVEASVLPMDDCDVLLGTDLLLQFDFGFFSGEFQIVLQQAA